MMRAPVVFIFAGDGVDGEFPLCLLVVFRIVAGAVPELSTAWKIAQQRAENECEEVLCCVAGYRVDADGSQVQVGAGPFECIPNRQHSSRLPHSLPSPVP